MQPPEFFQRQNAFTMQCGMHSINNLLRRPAYNSDAMVRICYQLSDAYVNPHKHPMGGDYDANVIMVALQQQGYECEWVDNRKEVREYIDKHGAKLLGLLVNKELPRRFWHALCGFSARHWYCVRKNGQNPQAYSICDSNLQTQEPVESMAKLLDYLKQQMASGSEVICVYKM